MSDNHDPYTSAELNLSAEETDQYISLYVRKNMCGAASYTYADLIAKGATVEQALYQATFTDLVNQALVAEIARHKENEHE